MSATIVDVQLLTLILNRTHSKALANFDQLSILWTTCMRNVQDSFRIKNLSWRLWYRQIIMNKKSSALSIPVPSQDLSAMTTMPAQLKRSRSVPVLFQHVKHSEEAENEHTTSAAYSKIPSKFYIGHVESNENEGGSNPPLNNPPKSPFPHHESKLHTPKVQTAIGSSKPVSLLSKMLQQSQPIIDEKKSSLRRCGHRYTEHLNWWFASNV